MRTYSSWNKDIDNKSASIPILNHCRQLELSLEPLLGEQPLAGIANMVTAMTVPVSPSYAKPLLSTLEYGALQQSICLSDKWLW
jgi:hypothetical protein